MDGIFGIARRELGASAMGVGRSRCGGFCCMILLLAVQSTPPILSVSCAQLIAHALCFCNFNITARLDAYERGGFAASSRPDCIETSSRKEARPDVSESNWNSRWRPQPSDMAALRQHNPIITSERRLRSLLAPGSFKKSNRQDGRLDFRQSDWDCRRYARHRQTWWRCHASNLQRRMTLPPAAIRKRIGKCFARDTVDHRDSS